MRNENELIEYAIKQESICRKNDSISDSLFEEYGVNRGLRDQSGKGVLTDHHFQDCLLPERGRSEDPL